MNHIVGVVVSIILFGFFILIVMMLNENVIDATYNSTFEKNSQQSIVGLVDVLNFDFPKIGHRKMPPKLKPGYLDSSSIVYYSDFDNNGSVDSIKYTLGDIEGYNLPNPNVRHLYRQINNQNPQQIGVGIVRFKLTYLDSSMTEISYGQLSNSSGVNKIRSIKLQIRTESLYKFGARTERLKETGKNNKYKATYWEKTFTPRSLML